MEKYDVLCVGFAVQDIVMQGIPREALERDSTCAKKTLVAAGGDAVNQAAVLAKLGRRTALIANFGRDPVGVQIAADMEANGVDITHAVRDGVEKTSFSVVVIRDDGQRSFLVGTGKGDNIDLSPEQMPFELLGQTRAVSIGSLFFLKKLDGAGAASIFKAAKAKGVLTFADMTADAYGIGPEGVAEIYPYTDYIMPSYEEAVYAAREEDPDAIADYFLERGVGTCVIKMGSRGCFVKNRSQRFMSEAFAVKAVDTTGCGDAFCGAFISAVLDGMGLEECVRYASAAGAINATVLGAHTAVKSDSQVRGFMEEALKNTEER